MADLPQTDPESRTAHFNAGASGSGAGVYAASALPRVQQAPAAFDPSSVLMAANTYSGVGNGSSNSTMRISNPYGQSMKEMLQTSGSGKTTP